MLSPQTQIGSTTQGTTFADIIINNVQGAADGRIKSLASLVHEPAQLVNTVKVFNKAAIPKKFADAVMVRRIETQKLDDVWRFPLNMTCPTTCPLPWTLIEATTTKVSAGTTFEFNIMRTVDFIGRNFLKISLPAVNTSQIQDSSISSPDQVMSDPEHIYLGAWHRDLVPRIVDKVTFFPRNTVHALFEYSGYDIYVHNILFGNDHKEMNDLMAGEDKFELCYDPYRVDGSAMGIASFKGIDAFSEYTVGAPDANGFRQFTQTSTVLGATDGITDYFQLDTTMDDQEFRQFYRKNVWYEAPVARNYHVRHSIHARRMFHQAKDIVIPLDILPFGYSIASSLPTASIAGDCGFIAVQLHADWVDRAFYLTKCSDVPSLHPIVNHVHYAADDTTPEGDKIAPNDPRFGWVNERSLGRFGDPEFEATRTKYMEEDKVVKGFDTKAKFATAGNVLGGVDGINRENIVPTSLDFNAASVTSATGLYRNTASATHAAIKKAGNWTSVLNTSTTNDLTSANRSARLTDASGKTAFIHTISSISTAFAAQVKSEISVKLLQVGYQTLPCIREFLVKLPNIYLTTEWQDITFDINSQGQEINNDLFIQAIMLWFIPTDANGVESMRLYPHQMIDHELPLIAGLKMSNESGQGTIIYDWATLNVLNPAQMELSPLIENMGLISFSPMLKANEFPYAFYDSNISGKLRLEFMQGEGATNINSFVNMKSGKIKAMCIGINGIALANLQMYRLMF